MELWVNLANVEVVRRANGELVCRVGDRRVTVPAYLLKPGSEVWAEGDRGKLVVPRWFAADAGLVS